MMKGFIGQVTLDQNSLNTTSDEIGYVVTSSLEEFSKLSWSVIKERKQILFNSLENNDVIIDKQFIGKINYIRGAICTP